MRHKAADEFFRMAPDERNFWLRVRTEPERDALFEILADDERLHLSDIAQLEPPFRFRLTAFLLGDPQLGISPPANRRRFTIRPVKDPVRVQVGARQNKRIFRTLKKQETLEPAEALLFYELFGPYAEIEVHRGLVEEVIDEDRRSKSK